MIRSAAVLILVGATILLISGLSGAHRATAALGPIVVEITDDGYNPLTLAIPPHTTVTWTNRGTVGHAVTGDSGRPDSPTLEPHYAYSYTFHNEGTFAYHDRLHPELAGSIVVAEGTPLPPPPAPTPTPTPVPTSTPAPAPTATPTPTAPSQPTALTSDAGAATVRQWTSVAGAQSASAGRVTVDAGNEWFGDPSFQGGVYEATVSEGSTVEWNVTEGIHNVYECGDNWSNASNSCDGAAWSSDTVLTQGGSFSHAFDTAGIYYYLCIIHPQAMRGKVVVEAGDSAGEDPTPTPVADDTNSGDVSAGGDTDGTDATPTSAENPAANPDAAVAGEAALPNGGGAPPVGGGVPTTPFFVAAAIAFAASGLIFWRWKQVSTER